MWLSPSASLAVFLFHSDGPLTKRLFACDPVTGHPSSVNGIGRAESSDSRLQPSRYICHPIPTLLRISSSNIVKLAYQVEA